MADLATTSDQWIEMEVFCTTMVLMKKLFVAGGERLDMEVLRERVGSRRQRSDATCTRCLDLSITRTLTSACSTICGN